MYCIKSALKNIEKTTWKKFFLEETKKPYFNKIINFLKISQDTIYPQKNDIFKAFQLTSIDNIKVVIIGQDPYHGENQADGLAFSCRKQPLPPSLQNIIKEMGVNKDTFNGDLSYLAKQGVLLINSSLTVVKKSANSHQSIGWSNFLKNLLLYLNNLDKKIVYLLWGNSAISYSKIITTSNALILTSPHPSPLSAYRGFLGCSHFIKTNEFLSKNNITPIVWNPSKNA